MTARDHADLVPLFLRFADRRVLVVGGGPVGTKKAQDFFAAGARVTVVSPQGTPELEALAQDGSIAWTRRAFEEGDVDGRHLVVSATNDRAAQAAIFRAADARGTFVLAVDDPDHGSAASGALLRRPPFLVAISSSGELPALTRLVREVLEAALPTERYIAEARALRARWKRDGTPMGARFDELVHKLLESRREDDRP